VAFSSIFDLITLLIASVIPDMESICIILLKFPEPLHGFFHSYVGASALAVLVAVVVYLLRDTFTKILQEFRVSQKSSFQKIVFTSFADVYFHVFLDSLLYQEMAPLYPLQRNPFVGIASMHVAYMAVYGFCSISLIFGIVTHFYKISKETAS
jgi:membrane-bound metal-dependent hydrolase YbcI (DUF457 family)